MKEELIIEQNKKAGNLLKIIMTQKRAGRPIMTKANCENKSIQMEVKPMIDENEEDRKNILLWEITNVKILYIRFINIKLIHCI